MKNIFIFGDEKFKKNIKTLLSKNHIEEYEIINSNETLMDTIQNNPKDCYLIDHQKIYSKNFLHKYLKFLIPKNSVEKSFLEEHSIGQLEFDSSQKAIDYINLRYNSDETSHTEALSEDFDDEIEEKNLEIDLDEEMAKDNLEETFEEELVEEPRDLSKITDIEEIEIDDLDEISEMKTNKEG